MIFKCNNCGANTVWNPDKQAMCCPHCDGLETQNEQPSPITQCPSCGAPLSPKQYESASKCPQCGSYLIFEERITGEYTPHLVLPFMVSKKRAKELIREEFGKKLFLPADFLKEATLDKMEGSYIPFFLYDYFCDYRLRAIGQKVRRWRAGDYEYTETSNYEIIRHMTANFSRIPVDASIAMPDGEMDLLEPYDYHSLIPFAPKYLSGFEAEYFNIDRNSLEPRARQKARSDSNTLMEASITGYSSIINRSENNNLQITQEAYALLPVWNYYYHFRGKDYLFHLNGQTGKLVGKAPLSIPQIIIYTITMFLSSMGIMALINGILRAGAML